MIIDTENHNNVATIELSVQQIREYFEGKDDSSLVTLLDGGLDVAQGDVFSGKYKSYYVVLRVS